MRPVTLDEACARIAAAEPLDKAIGEFLDAFYRASARDRGAMLAAEPALFADERWNALMGGIAEYLFKRWAPDHPPGWIAAPSRYLKEPWFPHSGGDPAIMEYLTFASPAEFKSRNIMTEEAPLRRAFQPPIVAPSRA